MLLRFCGLLALFKLVDATDSTTVPATWEVILAVFSLLWSAVCWILINYFYGVKGKEYPFNKRYPGTILVINSMILIFNISLMVTMLSETERQDDGTYEGLPDWFYPYFRQFVYIPGAAVFCWLFTLKSFYLLMDNKIQQDLIRYRGLKNKARWKMSWWTRNRRLKTTFAPHIVIGVVVFCLIIFVVICFLPGDILYRLDFVYFYMFFPLIIPQLFLIGWMCWELSKCKDDSLRLKGELRWVGFWALMSVVVGTVIGRVTGIPETANFGTAVCMHILTTVVFYIPYKMYVEFKKAQQEKWSGFQGLNTFADLLSWEFGSDKFLEYLKTEFSSENLYFYKAVTKVEILGSFLETPHANHASAWKKVRKELPQFEGAEKSDPWDVFYPMMQDIHANYMGPTAPQEVNIPSSMLDVVNDKTKKMRAAYKNRAKGQPADFKAMAEEIRPHVGIYTDAKDEIRKLMKKDSFARFCKSDLYKNMQKEVQSTPEVQANLKTTVGSVAGSRASSLGGSGISNMSRGTQASKAEGGSKAEGIQMSKIEAVDI